LAYDGTAYAGWQRQLGQATIQQILEEALAGLTGAEVILHGAGRTDAGVHAEGMVASFHTAASIPESGLLWGLNSMLPHDIRVLAVEKVADDFHARYNAKGKVYEYSFIAARIMPPRLRLYTAQVRGPFAAEPVRQCLNLLVGTHDFTSFEGAGSRDPSRTEGRGAVRTIFSAELIADGAELYRIVLSGDGFLRHMVRNIVGTLFVVGRGRMEPSEFAALLAARNRVLAGATAPAMGLCLKKVFY